MKNLVEAKQPRVSVIVPTYNCDQYLSQALDSIFTQTYTDYEFIVINDGSTDDTERIIEPYLPKINYFKQENQGVSAARNFGINAARGELIAFLDADDLFLPHKLEEQVAVFDRHPEVGIVNSGFRIIGENGEIITEIEQWHNAPDLNLEDWLLYKPILPSAMMFRKEWLEKVGGFDSRFFSSEDVDIVLRMVAQGCQAIWLHKITANYRRHSRSATWKNSLKQARNSEAMEENFYTHYDLPESIAGAKNKFRFYHFVWLAWLCYQGGFIVEMAEYLQKSQLYGAFSWSETIREWIKCFKNCAELYGYSFDAYSFSKLPEWQATVGRLQISPLFNQYQQKITNYQQLLATEINHNRINLFAKNYYYLGLSLFGQKDLEQAITMLRCAIELEPSNAYYNNQLGKLFEGKHDLEDAISSYKRSLRLKPNNQEFTKNLDRVLNLQKRWQELTEYCQKLNQQKVSTKKSLKILIICPYPPYTSGKGGGAIRMFEQIKYFGKNNHLTVVSFIFNEADYVLEEELRPYCDRAFMVKLGMPMSPNTGNIQQQVYNFKTWNMWKILQQLSQVDFDIVFFNIIFTTSYYSLFSSHLTILDEQNIESNLLKNCQQTGNKELIADLVTEVSAMNPFVNADSEYQKLEAFENKMWQKFFLRTVVSEVDKQQIDKRCNKGETLVLKNGIDTQKIQPVNNIKSPKILYMGNMTYYPNIDAVLYFVEQILPLIQQQDHNISLCIAGREPPNIIKELATSHPNVEVIADPEDMSLVAQECIMSIVPLRLGSGTRIKILHAMAMGLPVVSTSLGYEGLEMIDGIHLLVRDRPQDFADGVMRIYQDRELWMKLRENGRQLVEKQYDWDNIFRQYESEILARIQD